MSNCLKVFFFNVIVNNGVTTFYVLITCKIYIYLQKNFKKKIKTFITFMLNFCKNLQNFKIYT